MIYVDEIVEYHSARVKPRARRCGLRWCHMTADSREELIEFADRLGLSRTWFMDHATLWHYDLTPAVRSKAVAMGAQEVVAKEHLVRLFRERTGQKPGAGG